MSNVSGGGSSAGVLWEYLPAIMPAGSAEALWQFDRTANDLVDRTGNGHNLSKSAGATFHSYSAEGLCGLGFAGAEYYTAALPTNLRITGALTIELQYMVFGVMTTFQQWPLVACAGDGTSELLAENCLYRFLLTSQFDVYQYFCEYGAGTNVIVSLGCIPTTGRIELATLTRSAAGAVTLYQNGQLISTSAGHVPEGGTNATFHLGWDRSTAVPPYWYGLMFSCRISAQELSAAQVLAVYEDIGPV